MSMLVSLKIYLIWCYNKGSAAKLHGHGLPTAVEIIELTRRKKKKKIVLQIHFCVEFLQF